MELNQLDLDNNPDEKFFAIKDHSFIFEILRNKMYKDPIEAICREIPCNARDAHREAGKADIPIEITLPTNSFPFLKIEDFGFGISPDRIENIFINYGSSTKRDDNTQTGGFGLGSKTPFAYSDNFTILTRYDGIEYNYQAYIDETKIGKLAILSKIPTTSPSGTQIIIPVQPKDQSSFNFCINKLNMWDVLPKLINDRYQLSKPEPFISTPEWDIYSQHDTQVDLLVDGILYKTNYPFKMGPGRIVLKYKIGTVQFSASRDNVIMSSDFIADINKRIDNASIEIIKLIQNKVDVLPSYLDAIYYVSNIQNIFSISQNIERFSWKNIPITREVFSDNLEITEYKKRSYFKGFNKKNIAREIKDYMLLRADAAYIHLDHPDIIVPQNFLLYVRKILPTVEIVYTISGTEEDYTNFTNEDVVKQLKIVKYSELFNKQYKESPVNSLYTFNSITNSFYKITLAKYKADNNKKLIVLSNNKTRKLTISNINKIFDFSKFLDVVSQYSVYYVPESVYDVIKPKLGIHELASDFVNQKISELDKEKVSALIFEKNATVLSKFFIYINKSSITDTKLIEFINHSKMVEKSLQDISYIYYRELIDFKFNDKSYFKISLHDFDSYVQAKYPFLYNKYFDNYRMDDIIQYINDMHELSILRENVKI